MTVSSHPQLQAFTIELGSNGWVHGGGSISWSRKWHTRRSWCGPHRTPWWYSILHGRWRKTKRSAVQKASVLRSFTYSPIIIYPSILLSTPILCICSFIYSSIFTLSLSIHLLHRFVIYSSTIISSVVLSVYQPINTSILLPSFPPSFLLAFLHLLTHQFMYLMTDWLLN